MSISVASAPPESALPPALTAVALPESRKNSIFFFGTQGPHGFLSNFSAHSFAINDVKWHTVEHYYQAQKFIGTDVETEIREATDPADARQLAKVHEKEVRSDWLEIKEKVMFAALLAKFSQNAQLATALIDTKNAFLVEHSKKDAYWGDGHANGLNRLGVLLMEVRSLIRKELGLPEVAAEEYVSESDAKSEAQLKKMLADLIAKSEAIDEGIIEASVPRTKRQIRTRPGTASKPYRTIDGTPLFEKDAETGKINVIDADIQIDPKSLTPAARTVTFLYQFEKRNRREANMREPEELEEFEEEDDEDIELEAAYAPPPIKPSMDDIIAGRALGQLLEECELAIVMASSLEDHSSDDFAALAVQLKSLRQELEKHVYLPQDEAMLDRILQTLSSIDTLVTGS
jgi:hypothetical protein